MEYLIIPVFLLYVFIFSVYAPSRRARKAQWMKGYLAHRGLYTKDQSIPENSLKAFVSALDQGYGSELDVQCTRDGVLVVFHDDTLNRMCGVDGELELKDWYEIQNLTLADSQEKIPTLESVLDRIDGQVPLMIEIKSTRRIRATVTAVKTCLENYQGPISIVSFDPTVLREVKRQIPETLRGQLMEYALNKKHLPLIQRFVLNYALMNGITRPDFISIRYDQINLTYVLNRLLGGFGVTWPLDSELEEAKIQGRFDTIIFEHYLPKR